jgi:hypothetical protein
MRTARSLPGELRHVDLADALSLVLLIRDTAEDRQLRLAEARELVDVLDAVGRHDQVARLRLERWLRVRGLDDEADRVA